MRFEAAVAPKEVVIIGGGLAGLEAAWITAARGHKVTLNGKEVKCINRKGQLILLRRIHVGGWF
jgi:pyruvate/2-oxoglutarate dehydrogenase complex dihydrolipoamide dehydrogenase (E3) component